jgi:Subtilase family
MAERRPVAPRTFFLNETHEHARGEPEGGGRVPTFSRIDWSAKGQRILTTLRAARTAGRRTADPLRETRVFLLSSPEAKMEQDSKAKTAKHGLKQVAIEFAGKHARVFERLDLQLLRVTSDGDALVYAKPETLDQLEATAARLSDAGKSNQARWAFLKEFRLAPIDTRVDVEWLDALDPKVAQEVVVEFQPVLTRADVDLLIEAIRRELVEKHGEQALGGGRDLSGRRWLRSRMRPDKIRHFATAFQSIQTIHAPLKATLFATPGARSEAKGTVAPKPLGAGDLPAVAIVDAGVPREHPLLAPYRRGQYRHPDAEQTDPGDHGSRVASRVVFGDVAAGPAFTPPPGRCRFLDVVLPATRNDDDELELDGKAIFDSMRDVARNYPDVRVFNLSLGSYLSLGRLPETVRQERLTELQDLDNFAFEHDVVVVVAAGNTSPGVIPNVAYPGHLDDPDWALGAWAAGFNTLVVGGYVPRPNTDGVAKRLGWPSPFTRVGPGVAGAPIPSFSASAGDCTDGYRWKAGLGVWTSNKSGDWEDVLGTSHAAPIVAREAALLLRDLQKYCPPGVQPFASTAKAFLRLVASHEAPIASLTARARTLANRTLGHGRPSADRLGSPLAGSAVFLWQGTLEGPGAVARVRVPVPRDWLEQAGEPRLRVVCAWNTPTSAGAPEIWACRKVTAKLRPSLDADALRGEGNATKAYPLIDKVYDVGIDDHNSDEWVLDVAYEDVAPYPPPMRVEDQQRVSVALELYDENDPAVSPQAAVQLLPMTQTMIRLGGAKQPIWSPIRIPTG